MSEAVVPLYHQIYVVLRQQIVEGRFGQGPLPGEIDLAKQFQASRVTMRRVFDRLVQEGLVRRHRGLGTFVNPQPPKPAVTAEERTSSLLDNIIDMGEKTSVKVISIDEVHATPEVAEALELQPGDPVLKVVRVRHYRNRPLSHITAYLPAALGRPLTRKDLETTPMLRLLEAGGVELGRATQVLSARLADVVVAPLLDVPVGGALLAVRRVVKDSQGRPVQFLLGQYRPDRYEYRMELSPAGGDSANVWVESEMRAGLND
ncbi:GntR family transcriptional regulator [Cupriavidus sp. USMAA2-4]|uniref:GntR family transcriptional regulator n=1 Tax=Cupriavidus malaysiensis TaxID=367825 RepID=A0ABM6F9H4_9BURK|nr:MULTISPECIES: GntR family transcriptional regulator [Cupriavidus]AOY95161.1 GntR family transcriptional regulator [Cupriavidus sp. USMAA2-4]AOZ01940.1 GntR family transcriptional regulator [Cupriavidus sp. USMAHM13]AOZ08322.1 GntR family transcriptional regulator [Cupriavidus malaysiensis]